MKNKYLLVLPAFNQEDDLQSVVSGAKDYSVDILVVDDGSTDNTKHILSSIKDVYKIHHESNQGYGQTLINSFKYGIAKGYDFIITMDTDGQHLSDQIPSFMDEIPKWDIVSGSRYLNYSGGIEHVPPDRFSINQKITSKINDITNFGLTDTFCGYKAYSTNALKKTNLTTPGYGMPLQVWIQAWKMEFRIKEIPVKLIYNDFTKEFGNGLSNPDVRLDYYLSIIENEVKAGSV